MGNWALSVNNAQFVSVDLTGEKNQVMLEFGITIEVSSFRTITISMCSIPKRGTGKQDFGPRVLAIFGV